MVCCSYDGVKLMWSLYFQRCIWLPDHQFHTSQQRKSIQTVTNCCKTRNWLCMRIFWTDYLNRFSKPIFLTNFLNVFSEQFWTIESLRIVQKIRSKIRIHGQFCVLQQFVTVWIDFLTNCNFSEWIYDRLENINK